MTGEKHIGATNFPQERNVSKKDRVLGKSRYALLVRIFYQFACQLMNQRNFLDLPVMSNAEVVALLTQHGVDFEYWPHGLLPPAASAYLQHVANDLASVPRTAEID